MSYRATRARRDARLLARDFLTLRNWRDVAADRLRKRRGGRTARNALVLRNGLTFELHPGSTALYSVFVEIFYERRYDRHPLFEIAPDDIVVDIGANIGLFALKAARAAPHGHVYAYEPCSLHFDLLSRNVHRNGLGNVSVFRQAVWQSGGEVELLFSMDAEPNNTSLFTSAGGDRKEIVESVSLADVFRQNGIRTCDFLKLDCEGAEYEILFGAPDEILRSIRRIVLEWHRFEASHAPDRLAGFLEDKGFVLLETPDPTRASGHLQAYRP